jgi:hypothetical protein
VRGQKPEIRSFVLLANGVVKVAPQSKISSVPESRTAEIQQDREGVVPRDGVEPPTPAFSGLRSTT